MTPLFQCYEDKLIPKKINNFRTSVLLYLKGLTLKQIKMAKVLIYFSLVQLLGACQDESRI